VLKLTAGQKAEFEQLAKEDSQKRLAHFVRNNFGPFVAKLTDDAILAQVKEVHKKADGYGIKSNKGVVQFVSLSFVAGLSFDEIPQVQRYLKIDSIGPEAKVDMLMNFFERRLHLAKEG
jgi:hypothetical protein